VQKERKQKSEEPRTAYNCPLVQYLGMFPSIGFQYPCLAIKGIYGEAYEGLRNTLKDILTYKSDLDVCINRSVKSTRKILGKKQRK
jgi:hypothetical protein